MDITDELLMAYADGELAEPEASELARRIAAEPDLAARAAMFAQTRALFARLPADPVPDALADRVRAMAAPNVVQFAPRKRAPLWQMSAAAAVALAVGLGAGLSLGPQDNAAQIASALDTLPSGQELSIGGQTLAAISTFRTPAGDLCREYEHDANVTVACRADGAWQTRLAVATGGGDGYAPVSGIDALDAWLGAVEAGDPLDAGAEAAALAAQ